MQRLSKHNGDRKLTIIVAGYPGSGKTTLSKSLSRVLDCYLIDKDDYLPDSFSDTKDCLEKWLYSSNAIEK